VDQGRRAHAVRRAQGRNDRGALRTARRGTAIATHSEHRDAFPVEWLPKVAAQIRGCPLFAVNNLNRDFVGTRGFSVVFRRGGAARLGERFPFLLPFAERVLRADCNAFYLNPLELRAGSRVDPHIDRSLRSYCVDIAMPQVVSVLYVEVAGGLRGGRLVLQRGRRLLARVQPEVNLLVEFDGDLTHSIEAVDGEGARLSLVCEQYQLSDEELEQVPEFAVESRARY
jgi:hypothetical protein